MSEVHNKGLVMDLAELAVIKKKILTSDAALQIIAKRNEKIKEYELERSKLVETHAEQLNKVRDEYNHYKRTNLGYMDKYVEAKKELKKLEPKYNALFKEHHEKCEPRFLKLTAVIARKEEQCFEHLANMKLLEENLLHAKSNTERSQEDLAKLGMLEEQNKDLQARLDKVNTEKVQENLNKLKLLEERNKELEARLKVFTHVMQNDNRREVFCGFSSMETLRSKGLYEHTLALIKQREDVDDEYVFKILEEMQQIPELIQPFRDKCLFDCGVQTISKRYANACCQTKTIGTADRSSKSYVNASCQTTATLDPTDKCSKSYASCQTKTDKGVFIIEDCSTKSSANASSQTKTKQVCHRGNQVTIKTVDNGTQCANNEVLNTLGTTKKIQTDPVEVNEKIARKGPTLKQALAVLKRSNISITISRGKVIKYCRNPPAQSSPQIDQNICKMLMMKLDEVINSRPGRYYDSDSNQRFEFQSIDSGYNHSDCETSSTRTNMSAYSAKKLQEAKDFGGSRYCSDDEMSVADSYVERVLDEMRPPSPLQSLLGSPPKRPASSDVASPVKRPKLILGDSRLRKITNRIKNVKPKTRSELVVGDVAVCGKKRVAHAESQVTNNVQHNKVLNRRATVPKEQTTVNFTETAMLNDSPKVEPSWNNKAIINGKRRIARAESQNSNNHHANPLIAEAISPAEQSKVDHIKMLSSAINNIQSQSPEGEASVNQKAMAEEVRKFKKPMALQKKVPRACSQSDLVPPTPNPVNGVDLLLACSTDNKTVAIREEHEVESISGIMENKKMQSTSNISQLMEMLEADKELKPSVVTETKEESSEVAEETGCKLDEKPTQPLVTEKKIVWTKAKKMFRRLVLYQGNEIAVNAAVRFFQGSREDKLLCHVLSVIRLDSAEPVKGESPFEPCLTMTQKVVIGLLLRLENDSIFPGVTDRFMDHCEKNLLFVETDPTHVMRITKVYAALCKMKKLKMRLRRTLCDSMYHMGDLAVPFIHHMLLSWIQILNVGGDEEQLKDKPVIQVLIQLVHTKTCTGQEYYLSVLKNLLEVYYKYPRERYNENNLIKDFLQQFMCTLREDFATAIIILCKIKDNAWAFKQIALIQELIAVAKYGSKEIVEALVDLIRKIQMQFHGDSEMQAKAYGALASVQKELTEAFA